MDFEKSPRTKREDLRRAWRRLVRLLREAGNIASRSRTRTRAAYFHACRRFFAWSEHKGLDGTREAGRHAAAGSFTRPDRAAIYCCAHRRGGDAGGAAIAAFGAQLLAVPSFLTAMCSIADFGEVLICTLMLGRLARRARAAAWRRRVKGCRLKGRRDAILDDNRR